VPDRDLVVDRVLPLSRINLGLTERWASAGIGAALLAAAAGRGRGGMVLAAIGGALVARGMTGHCPLYHAVDPHRGFGHEARDAMSRPHEEMRDPRHVTEALSGPHPTARQQRGRAPRHDKVEQASEHSFPASDPPSFSPGKA
jgi:hypothetical protein